MNKPILYCARALFAVVATTAITGCVVHVDPTPPPGAVVVDQGYYYDGDYWDEAGVYHPRVYYFYDGHDWIHRDYAPDGVYVHDRAAYYHARGRPFVRDYGHPGRR